MFRNRFLALLMAVCLLVSVLPIHAHASGAATLEDLCHSRQLWNATHQVQVGPQGQRLVSTRDQGVLAWSEEGFLVNDTLGTNCQWGIAEDGFLYILCEGEMPRLEAGQYPWNAYTNLFSSLCVLSGTIADNAFAGCNNLQLVRLEDGVSSIGRNAFSGCTALEEFWFYGAAPSIADDAFTGTQNYMFYHFGDTSFDSLTDKSFGGQLFWVEWVSAIDGGMFGSVEWTVFEDMSLYLDGAYGAMQDLSSPEAYPWHSWSDRIIYVSCSMITHLGKFSLAGFSKLKYADFDEALTSLGDGAFQDCDGFSLTFAGKAPTLGEEVFTSKNFVLDYPENDPTWTQAVIDLFYGKEASEEELPPPEIPSDVNCGITAQQVYNAMMALQPQYPEGMPWTNDDYYAWNGGFFTGGYGCAGFAFILSDAAFGTEPSRLIEEDITIDDIRVGDILRINNDTHSVIVLEVHDDHLVIAEGNYNRSIHWGRTLSAKTVAATTDYVMTRYPEHRWKTGTCQEARTCTVCGFSDGVTGNHVYTDDGDSDCNLCGFLRETEDLPAATMPLSAFELEVLRLTNLERLAMGLDPLTSTQLLQKATDIRAQEVTEVFDHTRPNGTSCFTVLDEVGITYWSAAENIAYGYRTPAAVVEGWMNSPGHRGNILKASLGHMGVGECNYGWVQLFTDAPTYTSIHVPVPEGTVVKPGTSIDDMGLVAILRNQNGDCWLPLASAYCSGYDPSVGQPQTVTVSVLGVSCTFTITPEAHTHNWVEATCETPKTCPDCGKAEGAPLGHEWKAADCETPKTCLTCGKTEGSALGHDWNLASCEEPGTCKRCGISSGEALGHNWTDATCQAPKTCLTCGKTEGTPGSHNWNDGIVTQEPTIESEGQRTFTCLTCGITRTEPIPATLEPFVKVEKPDTVASKYGLSYDIPQDGATVLIFFSPRCGNSQYLMSMLNQSDWVANPWLNVVAVDCYTGSDSNLESFRNTYTPDAADHIQYNYANSNSIAFAYFKMMGGGNSLTWPLVLVITGSAEDPVVRFGCDAMTHHSKLEEILRHVSPAFAGWDGTVHQHNWVDATCQAPKTCLDCGATEGNPLEHNWAPATCLAPMRCTACGLTEGTPTPHDWEKATCLKPQTCRACGQIQGEPLGHAWNEASCTAPKTCSKCGATEGKPLPHQWKDATCQAPKTCLDCGFTEGNPLEHNWVPATCHAPMRCSACGLTEGTPTPHVWEEATCLEPQTCRTCGQTQGEPLGHAWSEASCIAPKTCFECGATEGKPLPHQWKEATCQKPKTCLDCGSTEGKPLEHNWAPADCLVASTCQACGQTQGEALGHDWLNADCQLPNRCSRCEATEGTPLPHNFQEGICTMCGMEEQIPGDANGDGVLNYRDALLVLRCSIGLEQMSPEMRLMCDVTGDGKLNYRDALLILRRSIGLE